MVLAFENFSVRYQKSLLAVNDVSLCATRGSILAVVGESGSGKSTLIRSVIGLLPPDGEIVSGRMLFCDENITHPTPSRLHTLRGKEIAMVFQDARASLNPRRKIGSQFIESLRCQERYSVKEATRIALEVLADVRMTDPKRVMDSYSFELSGGMCQRVALAMSISKYVQPKLLLADEPTSSLDVTMQAQMIRRLLEYRDRFGTSIVIVTHNFGVAAYMADYIAVMKGGSLVEWGERDRIILSPHEPYTRRLLDAVPQMEVG